MFRWKNKQLEKSNVRERVFSSNSVAYVILFASVLAMTFFGVCNPQQGGLNLGGVAAKVGDTKITYQEFSATYNNTSERFRRIYQDAFDPASIPGIVMEQLVEQSVVYEQARSAGVGVSEKEVDENIIESFKDESGKNAGERFKSTAKANGFSEDQFYEIIRRGLVTQKYRQFAGDVAYLSTSAAKMEYQVKETKLDLDFLKLSPSSVKVSITPADVTAFLAEKDSKKRIEDYYKANAAEFNKEKRVRASHILIAYEGARRADKDLKRKKDEAKTLATKVLGEVKAAGANFAELAKKYTDELSGRQKGGDLGYFRKGDMAPAFAEASFGMKKGEISDVVETDFGFHVIRVVDVELEDKKTLEQATDGIARKLIENDRRPDILARRAERILEELKAGDANKTITEYGYKWASTGEFSANARSIPGLGSDDSFQMAAFKLTKAGEVYGEVLSEGDEKYIVRLKSRVNPDMAAFDESKRLEIVREASYRTANTLFTAVKDAYSNKLDANGSIWRNQEYLTIAQRSNGG
jgi:peptidyl-prolyl cis-trans isomerase D